MFQREFHIDNMMKYGNMHEKENLIRMHIQTPKLKMYLEWMKKFDKIALQYQIGYRP